MWYSTASDLARHNERWRSAAIVAAVCLFVAGVDGFKSGSPAPATSGGLSAPPPSAAGGGGGPAAPTAAPVTGLAGSSATTVPTVPTITAPVAPPPMQIAPQRELRGIVRDEETENSSSGFATINRDVRETGPTIRILP